MATELKELSRVIRLRPPFGSILSPPFSKDPTLRSSISELRNINSMRLKVGGGIIDIVLFNAPLSFKNERVVLAVGIPFFFTVKKNQILITLDSSFKDLYFDQRYR